MIQEEKQILIKDLCARLPYGVIVSYQVGKNTPVNRVLTGKAFDELVRGSYVDERLKCSFKPYLRPMSSMTEEEAFEMFHTVFHQVSLIGVDIESDRFRFKMVDDGQFAGHTVLFFDKIYSLEQSDWLLSHHFDYRGLIPMGLALEAKEGMYKTE